MLAVLASTLDDPIARKLRISSQAIMGRMTVAALSLWPLLLPQPIERGPMRNARMPTVIRKQPEYPQPDLSGQEPQAVITVMTGCQMPTFSRCPARILESPGRILFSRRSSSTEMPLFRATR